MARVEAREHVLRTREQGHQCLAQAQDAMVRHEFSAARTALASANALLETASDEQGLAQAQTLLRQVDEAESSRSRWSSPCPLQTVRARIV